MPKEKIRVDLFTLYFSMKIRKSNTFGIAAKAQISITTQTHSTSLKGLNLLESIFLTEMARRIFKVGFALSKLTYLHRTYRLSGPCSFSVSVCQLIN